MSKTVAKFMSIAVTAVVIAGLVFGVGVDMIDSETNDYQERIEGHSDTSTLTDGLGNR